MERETKWFIWSMISLFLAVTIYGSFYNSHWIMGCISVFLFGIALLFAAYYFRIGGRPATKEERILQAIKDVQLAEMELVRAKDTMKKLRESKS